MSGGYFNDYSEFRMTDVAEAIEEIIKENDNKEVDKYGTQIGRGFTEDTIRKFKETCAAIEKVAAMIKRVDYLLECDDSEKSFHTRWKEDVENLNKKDKEENSVTLRVTLSAAGWNIKDVVMKSFLDGLIIKQLEEDKFPLEFYAEIL